MKRLLLGLATATIIGGPAAAVQISPGQQLSNDDFIPPFDGALSPGEVVTYFIEPTEPLLFDGSLSGTGNAVDLDLISITVNGAEPVPFDTVTGDDSGGPGTGTGMFLVSEFREAVPFGIDVFLPSGALGNVSLAFSAEAAAVSGATSPIPLPAGAWLLLSAFAGLGMLRARRDQVVA